MEATGRWQSYGYDCVTRQYLRDHDIPYQPTCSVNPWVSYQCDKTTLREWSKRDQRYDFVPLTRSQLRRQASLRVQY
jgi:hypothetical protein